jgi:methylthioribose-1-phosphate isomerase
MKVIEWLGDRVKIIDQTELPASESYLELAGHQDVARAIRNMNIRGAPAIGVAAAYGIALGAQKIEASSKSRFLKELKEVSATIAATRPTARNLFQVVSRMNRAAAGADIKNIKKVLADEAVKIHTEQEQADRKLGQLGADLIRDGSSILTHCNTGPLATAGYGTALGIIIRAQQQGKEIKVLATETRPRCQGARLTAWELKKAGVAFKLITDSMAGYFMQQKDIDLAIVGADRITANGDTANKIGTYTLAVLARENNIPFYVAAPTTTIDPGLTSGDEIDIEQRSPEEVTHIGGVRIAPEGVTALNPAFDVTPHRYITTIITEKGIIREPFGEGIGRVV